MQTNTTPVSLRQLASLYQPETITSDKFVPDGQYQVYGAGGVIGRYNQYNHEHSTLMVSCRGVCGHVDMSMPKSFIIGNQMVIAPFDTRLRHFLYYYLLLCDLKSVETGSVQKQITRTNLEQLTVLLPHKRVLSQTYDVFQHIHEQCLDIQKQTVQLQNLKANVLPLLMNHQLS